MKWYELEEKERTKEVFGKYTIQQFWDWWSKGEGVMEVRIKDWNIVKEVGTRFKLPYSPSGVYVWTAQQLKNVIAVTREKVTVWFGINPKKKNYNKKGWKVFSGKDEFIESLSFIFIDIDRVQKGKPATKKDLKNCDEVAELILERLGTEKWNEDYCKICSGNGVQLLIRLDVPIKITPVIFNTATKEYDHNADFEQDKIMIKNGIGKQIASLVRKYKDKLGVEVDTSAMYIGKVGALHATKNYKYGGYTWRGIIDLKEGENTGLTDYILTSVEDVVEFKKKNIFASKTLGRRNIIRPGKLKDNKLVKFLLENDLPEGQRNNTVWMTLKILLRDSKFDLNSNEFRKIHKQLESKLGDLTLNFPDKQYKFNESVVNNFCIQVGLPPVYELWPTRTKKLNNRLEDLSWEMKDIATGKMILKPDTTIFEDMQLCKNLLKDGSYENANILGRFMKACVNKYGEVKAKYYHKYLFDKFFNFD